jgi:hypothetical protein
LKKGIGFGVVERMWLKELRGFFAFSCLLGFAISWFLAVLPYASLLFFIPYLFITPTTSLALERSGYVSFSILSTPRNIEPTRLQDSFSYQLNQKTNMEGKYLDYKTVSGRLLTHCAVFSGMMALSVEADFNYL